MFLNWWPMLLNWLNDDWWRINPPDDESQEAMTARQQPGGLMTNRTTSDKSNHKNDDESIHMRTNHKMMNHRWWLTTRWWITDCLINRSQPILLRPKQVHSFPHFMNIYSLQFTKIEWIEILSSLKGASFRLTKLNISEHKRHTKTYTPL